MPIPIERVHVAIRAECDEICELLLVKSAAYGDSIFNPVRIFSKSEPEEALRVRIDDKLSRILKGLSAGEDVELDLIGYLILMRIARRIKE